jgi:hypothetical protein
MYPSLIFQSIGFKPAALTSTKTFPGDKFGVLVCLISITSLVFPYLVI